MMCELFRLPFCCLAHTLRECTTCTAMADSSAAFATTVTDATPHCRAIRSLLGKTITCTLDDGRTATGSLVCVDRLKNIILTNVIEERWVDSSVYALFPKTHRIVVVKRELSQAMIPGEHLVRVQVTKSLYQERVAPHLSRNHTTNDLN